MKKWIVVISVFATLVLLAACTDDQEETQVHSDQKSIETVGSMDEGQREITVPMYNKDKEKIGEARLIQVHTGMNIQIEASNLPPGTHGFHIHEKGSCEAPDFKSAGGHFNPTNAKHGFDNPKGPHAGDLPNIEVGKDGTVVADVTADMVTLKKGKKNSLLREGGTALVIHSKADDYKSQPSGDAGERIACGVIGK